ncbi:MAG: lysine--tRNA ligase [Thermodesulfobacteriota bacterium]
MDDLNQLLKARREKARELAAAGLPLYPNDWAPSHPIARLLHEEAGEPGGQPDPAAPSFAIAGRIMGLRSFGKATFLHLADDSGRIQVYVKKDLVGAGGYALFRKLDLGDLAGFTGRLFVTRTGEPTLLAASWRLVAKALRPLPEKYHGLTDVETRYRQRYVDLMVNPEVQETFRKRVRIIGLVRSFLAERGFLEVETPMMQPLPGGATAKPFRTHHHALGIDLFLRIAPELYLKRLLVGGFPRVFEINRNFRNEGLSTRHNPEFTMVEFYQAYATYTDLMDLVEELITGVALGVHGTLQLGYQGQPVDLTPPWQRLTLEEALVHKAGLAPAELASLDSLMALARRHGIEPPAEAGAGWIKTQLFEELVEERLVNPTFITSYPTEVSPLARRNEADPEVTDRFELFITGREIANAFSELNDPVDQRLRFERQIANRGADEEIHPELDEDFIRALEYGMPPAAGCGIGIDRLVMLLCDQASIRDVILFPHLKPEARQ